MIRIRRATASSRTSTVTHIICVLLSLRRSAERVCAGVLVVTVIASILVAYRREKSAARGGEESRRLQPYAA
ncbi:MAG TPA: hypothetical protein VN178_12650 [Rubrobacter sp.]|nr:hypothetical protein [Rubrobacter sp.]